MALNGGPVKGKKSATRIREIDPERREDYQCTIDCIYRTEYSTSQGCRSSFRENSPSALGSLPTMEQFKNNVEHVRKMGCNILVFEPREGEVIAYCACMGSARGFFISEFIVKSPEQLKGYGRSFYGEIEEYARNQGYKRIILYPEGQGARYFWLKMGFRRDETDFWVKKI